MSATSAGSLAFWAIHSWTIFRRARSSSDGGSARASTRCSGRLRSESKMPVATKPGQSEVTPTFEPAAANSLWRVSAIEDTACLEAL